MAVPLVPALSVATPLPALTPKAPTSSVSGWPVIGATPLDGAALVPFAWAVWSSAPLAARPEKAAARAFDSAKGPAPDQAMLICVPAGVASTLCAEQIAVRWRGTAPLRRVTSVPYAPFTGSEHV